MSIKFETGENYTLCDLFSEDNRIIIPDLQRDYCWGGNYFQNELVSNFLNSLKSLFDRYSTQNEIFELGMIYGYEYPETHIQLCDGQQRITTLFLIIGMLNRYCTDNYLESFLLSQTEDGNNPYLNYSIRESSLYFINDLITHFFCDNHLKKVTEINSIDNFWYFNEYNSDPTIRSMLTALIKIEDFFDNQTIDYKAFGYYLLHHISFRYYNMGNRTNGEETFVVLNTTGEPLTSAQNIKPKILSEKDNSESEKWEEIENWFWKKRNIKNGNDTSDVGFEEFLRWICIIKLSKDKNNDKELENSLKLGIGLNVNILIGKINEIQRYWKALKWITDFFCPHFDAFPNIAELLSPKERNETNIKKGSHAIDLSEAFVLLPVLEFVQSRFELLQDDSFIHNVYRLYRFFSNIIEIENVSKGVNPLILSAIRMVDTSILKNNDIIDWINSENQESLSKAILRSEEIIKLQILSRNDNRFEIEKKFWDIQENNIFSHEILPLLQWAGGNNFSYEKFNEYYAKFIQIWHDDCDYPELDLTRRALLCANLNEYPVKWGTNYDFCWEYDEWKRLIFGNSSKIQKFLNSLNYTSKEKLIESMNKIIEKEETNIQLDEIHHDFATRPELLRYCGCKKIQQITEHGTILLSSTKKITYLPYRDLIIKNFINEKLHYQGWICDIWPGERRWPCGCAYYHNEDASIKFDINYIRHDGKAFFKIDFFNNTKKGKNNENLRKFISKNTSVDWSASEEKTYNTLITYTSKSSYSKVVKIISEVMDNMKIQKVKKT